MAKNCLIHLFIYLLVHITPINFTIPRKEASLYPLYQPPGSSCCSGSGERWRQLFTPSTVPGDCYLYQPRSQRTALRFLVISQFTTVFPSRGNMQKKHLPFSCLSLFTRSNAADLFHPWQTLQGPQKSWSWAVLFLNYFLQLCMTTPELLLQMLWGRDWLLAIFYTLFWYLQAKTV